MGGDALAALPRKPSARCVSTAFAAAAAWSRRPGWWKARTVMSSQADRASTPPSPACSTMSMSGQRSSAAAARSAARSSCRALGDVVWRVDCATGTHRCGSLQPQIFLRAHRGISSCSITTVGTMGTSTSAPRVCARAQRLRRCICRRETCLDLTRVYAGQKERLDRHVPPRPHAVIYQRVISRECAVELKISSSQPTIVIRFGFYLAAWLLPSRNLMRLDINYRLNIGQIVIRY
eukprot:5688662-Pleurochrysis_carterae.AAC.2